MKKLFLLLTLLSIGLISRAQNNMQNITGDFGFKYNESYHSVSFSEATKTFIELDKDKKIVSKGGLEMDGNFYLLTPKEITTNSTINIPVKFLVKEIYPEKLIIEIYHSEKNSQILTLVKL